MSGFPFSPLSTCLIDQLAKFFNSGTDSALTTWAARCEQKTTIYRQILVLRIQDGSVKHSNVEFSTIISQHRLGSDRDSRHCPADPHSSDLADTSIHAGHHVYIQYRAIATNHNGSD